MNNTAVFSQRILRIRRITMFRTILRSFLLTALFFLCGYTIIVSAEKFGLWQPRDYAMVYGGILIVSLVGALVYGYATRPHFMNILIDIDTRLQLHDRISTAYEYQTSRKTSEFSELLFEDAGQNLSTINQTHLLPFKFSWIHLLIALLIALNLGLLGVEKLSSIMEQPPLDPETKEKIKTTLQNYMAKQREPEKKAAEGTSQQPLYRQLEQMSKKFDDPTISQRDLMKEIERTLKEIQSQQDRLTEELETDLQTIENVTELPVRDFPRLRRLSQPELQKLEKMFGEMVDGEIPEDIERNLETLREYNDVQGMLEELMDDIEAQAENEGDPSTSGEPGSSDGEGEEEMESSQDIDNAPGGSQDGLPPEEMEQLEQGLPGLGIPGEEMGEFDEERFSSEHGRGNSSGEEFDPYLIERAQGSPLQDRMAPASRAEYNAHIRSLTTIGEARVQEEEVTRTYQQELESILQKEDIPLNYREYIKNYFISIGLTKGEETNVNTE